MKRTEVDQAIKKPRFTKKQRMMIKEVIMHVILITIATFFIFPFLWMVMTALKTPQELLAGTDIFFPQDPQWENFKLAVTAVPLSDKNMITVLSAISRSLTF